MSSPSEERIIEEVQALEAILLKDVVVKRVDDAPKYIIETVVYPFTCDDIDQQYVCVTLEVMLTCGYPDISPEVTLKNPRGLDDKVVESIHTQIQDKLQSSQGQPIVFELIGLVRDSLTESNLPSGQCVICLFAFLNGDVFIKTPCYHYFHSHCLANHLVAGKKYYQEELDKLPHWQQVQMPPYQQTCPVCRSVLNCNVETLKSAPLPMESMTEPPFHLTEELKQLQLKMAELLAVQIAKGGVIGMGDDGPPLLNITSLSIEDNASSSNGPSTSRAGPSNAAPNNARAIGNVPNNPSTSDQQTRQPYRGPYRGFNRRGRGGRRGRGAR